MMGKVGSISLNLAQKLELQMRRYKDTQHDASSKATDERIVFFNCFIQFFTTSLWKGLVTMKKKIIPYLVIFMMIAGISACASKPKEVTTEEVTKKTTTTSAQPVPQQRTTTTTTKTQ
jgi:hypothetical protein